MLEDDDDEDEDESYSSIYKVEENSFYTPLKRSIR